jgi:2-polyprenyl-6-methoxyphenol hydroxylase-like FAD-dependent oxidoreductase
MLFRRQMLLDLLYRRLPDRETRILTEKKVVSIETHAQGVRVRCDDGSIEGGSIAIGCDGVHSRVRGIMRDLALKSSAKVPDSETPMVAHYQLLAGYLRRIPHLQPGQLWEIRDYGLSMQVFMLEQEG